MQERIKTPYIAAVRLMVRSYSLEFLRNNLVASAFFSLIMNVDSSRLDPDNTLGIIFLTLVNLVFCLFVPGPVAAWLLFRRFQKHTLKLWYNLGFGTGKLFLTGLGSSWVLGLLLALGLAWGWPHG